MTNLELDEIMVDYVECYLDGYSREVYAIDIYIMGISATLNGIILDSVYLTDGIKLIDDIFDKMYIKQLVYQQYLDGDLEVTIHNK